MFWEMNVETRSPCTDLTASLRQRLAEHGAEDGLLLIQLPHTTAGLGITSFWDPRGIRDLFHEWERNVPARLSYRQECAPRAAAARTKSVLSGPSVTLMVHNGQPVLGSSQGVCLLEYDGPRNRTVWLKFVPRPLTLVCCPLTTTHMGAHDITPQLREAVRESGVCTGLCHAAMPHSTAGLAVCRAEDMAEVNGSLERLIPTRADFLHTETPWDAAGHVKTVFTGSQQTFAVENHAPVVGEEMALAFLEFDGPRERKVWIGVYG